MFARQPADAVYCYYDGLVLGGHGRDGGPVAVGSQPFASPFVFPSGRACRSFDELALACQDDWKAARELLQAGLPRQPSSAASAASTWSMAAKEAAKFPDHDRGLDQLLDKLPADVLQPPKLSRRNAGDQPRRPAVRHDGGKFELELENQGSGCCTAPSPAPTAWLSFGDARRRSQKHFQFTPRPDAAGQGRRRPPAREQQAARGADLSSSPTAAP